MTQINLNVRGNLLNKNKITGKKDDRKISIVVLVRSISAGGLPVVATGAYGGVGSFYEANLIG